MKNLKAIKQAHADELFDHCLSAYGVYEAFDDLIDRIGLKDVFPGFEDVKRELKETLETIDRETRGE